MKKQVQSFGEFTRLNEGNNDYNYHKAYDWVRKLYFRTGNEQVSTVPKEHDDMPSTIDFRIGEMDVVRVDRMSRPFSEKPTTGYMSKDLEFSLKEKFELSEQEIDELLSTFAKEVFFINIKPSFIKTFGRFKHDESRKVNENEEYEDDDYEEYEITADDEIDGQYCKDFNVSDLRVGDIIYRRLIDVDSYTKQWARDVEKLFPRGLASYDSPIDYEVVGFGDNTIKLK